MLGWMSVQDQSPVQALHSESPLQDVSSDNYNNVHIDLTLPSQKAMVAACRTRSSHKATLDSGHGC